MKPSSAQAESLVDIKQFVPFSKVPVWSSMLAGYPRANKRNALSYKRGLSELKTSSATEFPGPSLTRMPLLGMWRIALPFGISCSACSSYKSVVQYNGVPARYERRSNVSSIELHVEYFVPYTFQKVSRPLDVSWSYSLYDKIGSSNQNPSYLIHFSLT